VRKNRISTFSTFRKGGAKPFALLFEKYIFGFTFFYTFSHLKRPFYRAKKMRKCVKLIVALAFVFSTAGNYLSIT
jgi:hypothetical protein